MSFEFQIATVIDLVKAGILWVEDGNHGAQRPLSDEFSDVGTPFVRPDDLFNGAVRFANCDRINDKALQRIRKGKGKAGDIVFTHRATVGRIARVGKDAPNFIANPGVTIYRTQNAEVLDLNYLYYFMQTPFFMDQVWAEAGNTDTFPYVSLTQQRALNIRFPGIVDQRRVGTILGDIDDRISVLRDTNVTLEGIAKALFKSWFIDFSPVRAKMEGRVPEGMDEGTAALFPDSFEESVLGVVPRGWSTAPIYDMATFINGAAYKAFDPNADRRGRPIIKIAELKSGVTTQTAFSDVVMPGKYLIETGDILFSWSGNPDTSIDTFVWNFEPAWLNQHIFRVLPHEKWDRSFVLQMLRHLKPVFTELARNKQTIGLGHVTVSDMKREHIAMPTAELRRHFDQVVGPVLARIFENESHIQNLTAIRDTLLPRLISGQLHVPEAVEEFEAA